MNDPIVYVLKRFPRLSETFVINELLELEALGERVIVLALLPPEDQPRHPELEKLDAVVEYLPRRPKLRAGPARAAHLSALRRHPLVWARGALMARRSREWRRFVQAGIASERIRAHRGRHVHAHFASAAADVARDAAALAGVPWTVTAHAKDIFHADYAPRLANRVRNAKAIVTVSGYNRAHLTATLPGHEVVHIPNGVRVRDASPLDDRETVLCVARLVEKKGVDTLIRAVGLLAPSHPALRLVVTGGGPMEPALRELVEQWSIADRVTFTGSLDSAGVREQYRRAAVVALPCRISADGDRDGIPTVIVEAMAHGIPVVSTDVVGIPEVVRANETGLVVAPDDPTALADALAALLSNRTRQAQMGERARAVIADEFDPRRSAQRLRQVFGVARTSDLDAVAS